MRHKIFVAVTLMVFLLTGIVLFGAKDYQIRRFGDPKTAFYTPLRNVKDLRKMIESNKADIQTILQEKNWLGDVDDILRAVDAGSVTEISIAPGTRMPFIAMRRDGRPYVIDNAVWAGKGNVATYVVEFASDGSKTRFYVPKICGNFWIEEQRVVAPPSVPKPTAQGPGPFIDVRSADVCLGQPIRLTITVKSPPPGSSVSVNIDGKKVSSYPAKSGSSRRRYYPFQLGSHPVMVTLDGLSSSTVVNVQNCAPNCVIVPTRTLSSRGLLFGVDASGSTAAPGKIQSVFVTIFRNGIETENFEMRAPDLRREDLNLTKPGDYKINAVAVDEAGNKSQNLCSIQYHAPKKAESIFFIGGFIGKERLVQDDFLGTRDDPLLGFKAGILHRIDKDVEVELAMGAKIDLDDAEHSSLFADVALNRLFGHGFVGGGVSFWDINESKTRAGAALVQLGFDVHRDRRVQFVIEARAPFDKFDDLGNNYQVWGGIRLHPGR